MASDKETRIRLTAVDNVTQTLNSIRGTTRDLTGDFGKLGGALSALGVSGALAGLGEMVKSAIDAADSMGELSQRTGIAVRELTALDYAMRREGVSTEAFGKAMQQLSKNMVEAGDASSKTAKLFEILGINAAAGPREALLKLADAFAKLPDGATKSTLAMELLGKAGADLIPALNNGAEGIRSVEREAHQLGITFGDDMARAADAFKNKMFALTESTKSLGVAMAQEMLPGLNRITTAMREAAVEAGLWEAVLVGLGGLVVEGIGLNDDETQKTKKRIREISDELAHLDDMVRDGPGLIERMTGLDQTEKLKARIRELRAELGNLLKPKESGAAPGFVGPPVPSDLEARLRRGLATGTQSTTADPARNLLIGLQEEYRKLNDLTHENETLERVLAELKKDSYAKASKALKDQVIDAAKLIDAKKRELALDAQLAAHNQKELAAAAERGKALEALSNQWAEATKELEEELRLLGLTNIDREKALLLEKARADILAAGDNAAAIRDIRENLAQQLSLLDKIGAKEREIAETRRQAAESLAVWDELSSAAGDFFADLVLNGRDAFDNLKRFLKGFLAEMLALFAKRWVLNLAAGGSLLGAAGSAFAGGVGADSMAGAGLGLFGNLAGAGLTNLGGMIGGGFGSGLSMAGTMGIFEGLSVGASGLFTGGGLASLGAMIPGIGAILAGIAVLSSLFSRGGGPKVGGSFFTGGAVPGSDNGRFFTPSQGDEGLRQLVEGTRLQAGTALQSFGLRPAGFNFGLGFDHDPEGDARSRVSALVTGRDGRVIYQVQDAEMDDKEVEGRLQLESRRMILAALQASDLPEGVADIINSVADIGAATAETIDGVIGLARAYHDLGRVIEALEGGPLAAFTQQLEDMRSRVDSARDAFDAAIETRDPAQILAAEQELSAAIIDRYNREVEMVRNLQAAIRATEEVAYQFALSVAARINTVGGSRDVAGIAMGRAATLRSRIGGNAPIAHQIEDLQGYVGAIDTWYATRRDAIMRDAEAQAAAANAIAHAQQRAHLARLEALQREYDLATAYQALVDRTQQVLDDMRLSGMNPLPVTARLALAGQDVSAARSAYEGATGEGRIAAANRLLEALVRQRDLGMETFDRPSPEFQELYNSTIREITAIQDDAKPLAERAVELQARMLDTQELANRYASTTADASQIAAAAMAALNAETLTHYEWVEAEGARLYGIQRAEQQQMLDAITSGMEPNLFLAQRATETVTELRGLRSDIRDGFAASNAANGNRAPVTVNVTVTAGTGEGDDALAERIATKVKRAIETA